MKRRTPLRVHLFWDSGSRDHTGARICTCGSLENTTVHAVPVRTEEQEAHEARKVGEKSLSVGMSLPDDVRGRRLDEGARGGSLPGLNRRADPTPSDGKGGEAVPDGSRTPDDAPDSTSDMVGES